jgi:hypothetical protein
LPARVYWVRRTLVLAVALGLVFGVAQLLGGTGDPASDSARVVGSDRAPSTQAPTATSTADATGVSKTDRRDRARDDRKPKPEKTRTPLAQPTGPCRSSDVVVTPKVRETARADGVVHLRLKLTTLESPACTWTVSPESLVVKITSGEDRIWSSQDCPGAVPQTDVVVRKDVPAKVDMGWRARRSDSGCTPQRGWALPGFYHVQAAAFGAEPTDVQFELEAPVAPTRTAKPKPEKGEAVRADRKGNSRKNRNR